MTPAPKRKRSPMPRIDALAYRLTFLEGKVKRLKARVVVLTEAVRRNRAPTTSSYVTMSTQEIAQDHASGHLSYTAPPRPGAPSRSLHHDA